MSSQSDGRLAIAAIFLVFQAIFCTFDFVIAQMNSFRMRNKDWVPRLQYFFPLGFGALGIILVPIMRHATGDGSSLCTEDGVNPKIDPDIAGRGIRIAIWAQEVVLLVISIIGTFHNNATGVKEIGAGLGVTHISLAIALLVEMVKKREPPSSSSTHSQFGASDAILGSMILDSQNVALSMALITKDTLASRWQVSAIVICQVFGLVLVGIITARFGTNRVPHVVYEGRNETELCPNGTVAWWGELNPCPGVRSEMETFWVYYACRWLILLQGSFHALANMFKFHEAERHSASLAGTTFPSFVRISGFGTAWLHQWIKLVYNKWKSHYDLYPTTVSLMYVVYSVFSLASLGAMETAIDHCGWENTFSVGQVVAIVVAVVTILRGVWLFARTFREGYQVDMVMPTRT